MLRPCRVTPIDYLFFFSFNARMREDREQANKAARVAVIVNFVFAESGELFGVQAVGRFLLGRRHLAFVQLQHDFAVHLFRQRFGRSLQRAAQRREPAAVVHHIGHLQAQLLAPFEAVAIQHQLFDGAQRRHHDGAPGVS